MNPAFELAGVAILALLSENFILVNCMGIGARTKSFHNPLDALRSGYTLTTVMVLAALLSWPIDHFILDHYQLQHFRLLIFSLIVVGVVEGLRYLIRTFIPELSRRMDENLAAVTANCAALGSALLISYRSLSFGGGLLFALCGGIGATVVLTSFAFLQSEVCLDHCPKCFRGLPIQLITAGLMAMALIGFYGLNL